MPEEAGRLEEGHPGTTGCADGQGTQTHIIQQRGGGLCVYIWLVVSNMAFIFRNMWDTLW